MEKMKSKLLNTPFEMELRVLLLLDVSPLESLSNELILSLDFFSCYGKEFDISDMNLHGDGTYKYSELSTRNELLKPALISLVRKGFVEVIVKDGFKYQITDSGSEFINGVDDAYSEIYRETAIAAFGKYGKEDGYSLQKEIQERSRAEISKGAKNVQA